MKGVFTFSDPDQLEATVVLTASLAQWRVIARAIDLDKPLPWSGPGQELRETLRELIQLADKEFTVEKVHRSEEPGRA